METYGLLEGYSFFTKIRDSGGSAAVDLIIKEQEDKIKKTIFNIEKYLPMSNMGKHKSFQLLKQEELQNFNSSPKSFLQIAKPINSIVAPLEKRKIIKSMIPSKVLISSRSNPKYKFSTSIKPKNDPPTFREEDILTGNEKLEVSTAAAVKVTDNHKSIQSFFMTDSNNVETRSDKFDSHQMNSLPKVNSLNSIGLKQMLSEATKSLTEPDRLTSNILNKVELSKQRSIMKGKLDKDPFSFDQNRFYKSEKYKQTYIETLKSRLHYIEQDELNTTDSFDKDDMFPPHNPIYESKAKIKKIKSELGPDFSPSRNMVKKRSDFSTVKSLINRMSKGCTL